MTTHATNVVPRTSLDLVSVESRKVLYRPGETGVFTATLKNAGNSNLDARVQCVLIRDLDSRVSLGERSVPVPAGQQTNVQFNCPLGPDEYGYEVRMQLNGQESPRRDFFGVSSNVSRVGILGNGSRYANYTDTFAWAPDDFGNLSPKGEKWYSGQCGWQASRPDLQKRIDEWHARGIKALTYGKGVAGGPDGMALLVEHPEWASFNRFGQLGGLDMSFDVWSLKHAPEPVHTNGQGQGWAFWNCWTPNFYNTEAVDYGAEALVRSARMFAWDGVRFDGQFDLYGGYDLSGQPVERGEDRNALNARNVRLMRSHIQKTFPDFVFGYNYGFPVSNPSGMDRAICEGGGMVMDEGIRNSGDPQHPLNVWRKFAHHILTESTSVRSIGGVPLIFSMGASKADADYALAFCLAGAGNPYGWDYSVLKFPMTAFATRYSAVLWDPTIRLLDRPADVFKVESSPEVWWRDWTRVQTTAPGRRRYIVHLFNPPPQERLGGTPYPAPIANLRVTYRAKPGENVRDAWVLTPAPDVAGRRMDAKRSRRSWTIDVGPIDFWSVVVIDTEAGDTGARLAQRSSPTPETGLGSPGRARPPAVAKAMAGKPGAPGSTDDAMSISPTASTRASR